MKAENLLGALVVALVAAVFFSGRPFPPVNMPRIEEVATLPDGPQMEQVRRFTEYGSGILPYNAKERQRRASKDWSERRPVKLGYAYREVSFLRLPFWAYEEYGLVTFMDTPAGYQIAIMSPKQIELLQELTGKDWSRYRFPLWEHLWGWLFVLGFIGIPLLWLRERAKWREEQGII
jgi:hypothetical protein